jgi:hypothetical protein
MFFSRCSSNLSIGLLTMCFSVALMQPLSSFSWSLMQFATAPRQVGESGGTFAWSCRNRRISWDYEYLRQTGKTLIYVTMIRLRLKRMAK